MHYGVALLCYSSVTISVSLLKKNPIFRDFNLVVKILLQALPQDKVWEWYLVVGWLFFLNLLLFFNAFPIFPFPLIVRT